MGFRSTTELFSIELVVGLACLYDPLFFVLLSCFKLILFSSQSIGNRVANCTELKCLVLWGAWFGVQTSCLADLAALPPSPSPDWGFALPAFQMLTFACVLPEQKTAYCCTFNGFASVFSKAWWAEQIQLCLPVLQKLLQ